MRLLITGAWRDAPVYGKEILRMGYEILFQEREEQSLPCEPDWPQAVICNGLFQYHELADMTSLRYMQLTSAGLDRVPMEEIRKREILLSHAVGIYDIPMAEAAVGGVLQLYRDAGDYYEKQCRHIWHKNRNLTELCGKNVCIVGCGHVGKACAAKFHGMGCQVTGIRMYWKNAADMEEKQCANVIISSDQHKALDRFTQLLPFGELEKVLPETDILILTASLTAETRHMIGTKQLALLKPGAVLVNISRGALVDQKALEAALDHGLGGAVLDVFEEEPLEKNSRLWDMKHVILTPHSSFISDGSRERLNRMILTNLELWRKLQEKGYG